MRSRSVVLLQLGFAMIAPVLVYFILNHYLHDKDILLHPSLVYMIGFEALLAVMIFLIMGIVAQQLRNVKILFVSLAFASIGAMLIFHSYSFSMLETGDSDRLSIYAQLTLLLGSFWLWLSSLSADHRLVRFLGKHKMALLPMWCIALLLGGLLDVIIPGDALFDLLYSDSGARITTLTILLVNTWTVYRHLITYMASRFSIQLAIVYCTGWMNTAQVILFAISSSELGWWTYHSLLLLSMIVMIIVMFAEYRYTDSLTTLVKRLNRAEPDRWIETYITPSVSELVKQTEMKDAYTAGHNYRVTVYALKLGEEMGLSSTQLKSIALGGLVHDVGKLHVPDYVLNKPGKLEPDERKLIENHPLDGYNMCRQLGFMLEELAIIRSHHEKWDGTGYPDRLAGEAIPLVARVTAVADVYDALTSSRSYRKAMTHEKAMSIIQEESGTHFDPRCVEAWVKVVTEEKEFFQRMLTSHIELKHVSG